MLVCLFVAIFLERSVEISEGPQLRDSKKKKERERERERGAAGPVRRGGGRPPRSHGKDKCSHRTKTRRVCISGRTVR
jgi:hypothetical protein